MSKIDEEYYFKLGKRLALKDYQIRQDAKEIKDLKEEVERENKSHNYHCKESQRKNDVIHDLEEKLKDLKDRIEECREFTHKVQGADGNWNYDAYTHGLFNGMEFNLALMEGREPAFRKAPDEWLCDKKLDLKEVPG